MWLPPPPPLDLGIGHAFRAGLGSGLVGRQYAEGGCDEDRLNGSNENCSSEWRNLPLSRSVRLEAIAR